MIISPENNEEQQGQYGKANNEKGRGDYGDVNFFTREVLNEEKNEH